MSSKDDREAAREYAERLTEELSAANDVASSLYAVFSGELGKAALAKLRSMTIETPSWVPGQSVEWGYFREGQNDIVRRIEQLIEVGRKIAATRRNEDGG